MKPFNPEINVYDQDFKSMKNQINMTEEEQYDILHQINTKIDGRLLNTKKSPDKWKSYIALASAFLVLIILSVPFLGNVLEEGTGLFEDHMTAEEMVEKHYEAYNNKDFDAYYDMMSKRLKEHFEANYVYNYPSVRERLIKSWERTWRPVEVIKIEEQSGGTEKGTIVAATVHYPAWGTEPESTRIMTYKLVKENGEWKFDELISDEKIQ
ncbi:MAG TPA: nuclear transport factor 2 family protein [Bacillus sp. (in: firmicutes)]|uniref:nuclear transport factor 2 family protein n=1 Tax=Bacillus litorisediminis TaxID=2922713 RepID=UPI001FADD538|nr:nuclear transport factor 2 family protein [Bacillus litorisediminis]HWO77825.1 nuclear transport factor 2 family protein [Bacillus sp. (in: firmicutes)]